MSTGHTARRNATVAKLRADVERLQADNALLVRERDEARVEWKRISTFLAQPPASTEAATPASQSKTRKKEGAAQ